MTSPLSNHTITIYSFSNEKQEGITVVYRNSRGILVNTEFICIDPSGGKRTIFKTEFPTTLSRLAIGFLFLLYSLVLVFTGFFVSVKFLKIFLFSTMFEPQHFIDLQDNSGFGDQKSWLSADHNSSPTRRLTQSSLADASIATSATSAATTNGNVDRVLFKNLVEIVPLVQSLIVIPPSLLKSFCSDAGKVFEV